MFRTQINLFAMFFKTQLKLCTMIAPFLKKTCLMTFHVRGSRVPFLVCMLEKSSVRIVHC